MVFLLGRKSLPLPIYCEVFIEPSPAETGPHLRHSAGRSLNCLYRFARFIGQKESLPVAVVILTVALQSGTTRVHPHLYLSARVSFPLRMFYFMHDASILR